MALCAAAAFARCGDLFVDPADATPIALALSLAASAAAGGSAEAFDKVDRIVVRLRAGQQVVFETERAFSSGGGDARVAIAVPATLAGSSLAIEVELARTGALLFVGSGGVTPEAGGDNAAEIVLQPVAVAVLISPASVTFDALQDRAAFSAAAVFATGDSIDGAAIVFRSLAPAIVQIEGGATAVALMPGSTRIEARYGDLAAEAGAIVQQRVTVIEVSQAGSSVAAGSTFTFTVALRDRNGFPVVDRAVQWSSSNPNVLQIDASGFARAVGTGTVTVTASVDAASASFTVRVVDPVPLAPTGLSGTVKSTVVSLRWQDNATNETSYEVLVRSGVGSSGFALAATLGADATSYTGDSGQTDAQLQYVVRACNGASCSDASAPVVLVTVPVSPSNPDASYNCSTNQYTLSWSDNSSWEQYFLLDIDYYGSVDQVQLGANETSYEPRSSVSGFQVAACNQAGCSSATSYSGPHPEDAAGTCALAVDSSPRRQRRGQRWFLEVVAAVVASIA